MSGSIDQAIARPAGEILPGDRSIMHRTGPDRYVTPSQSPEPASACFHCGLPCPTGAPFAEDKSFCCRGCLLVHDLLAENGLDHFYDLNAHPGTRPRQSRKAAQWAYLDELSVRERLLDFSNGKISRVTFHIPAIHCVACVWLLENLFRINPAVGDCRVNFARREVAITFADDKLALSELAALLSSLGYEPQLTLGELERQKPGTNRKRQWLQLGIAGFAFGNIMLFSLPAYLGLDSLSGPLFKQLFGWLSLALAAPVLFYSASDYWRSAWVSVRRRLLSLDVPIALGLAVLYAQSAFEVGSGRGEGYLDSLSGLVFLLLWGRAFQQHTHDRIAFDLDYKSFFPLAARRKTAAGDESVALSQLRVGDRLVVRNRELVPADSRLVSGHGLIDYSFVTGESAPVDRDRGDYLYAGGQQTGAAIEVETVKPVSQGYLTSLWSHEAFQKKKSKGLRTLTDDYSRRFTRIVIAIAFGAALFWTLQGDAARSLKAFTSVLIVACPCALALAAPFTLGTAQRLLAHHRVFLKNALVLERLADVDAIIFDKTGTLTMAGIHGVRFQGERAARGSSAGGDLNALECSWVHSLARHSTHPHSRRIAQAFSLDQVAQPVLHFIEQSGQGISGLVQGHRVRLGSRTWLESCRINVPGDFCPASSASWLSIDEEFRGVFILVNPLRPRAEQLLAELRGDYDVALLSGDNEADRARFEELLGPGARLDFNQTPLDKLNAVHRLQESGKTVLMVGDGLNDAGALKQSDVGVAVVEEIGALSPASDVIMEAAEVRMLAHLLSFARAATRIVRLSFGISAAYNLVGISIAAAGILSPLICAVLMPLSSVSVVLFACSATRYAACQTGISQPQMNKAPERRERFI